MTSDKSLTRKAKEQDQRAARHEKLERTNSKRGDTERANFHQDKSRQARNAAGLYRAADKTLKGK